MTMTQPRPGLLHERSVHPGERGVRLARRHMASALVDAGYGHGVVRWVEQVAAELLANAVLHGCTRPGERAYLRVTAEDGALLVSVLDPATDPPRAVVSWPNGEHGRGLLLVEALAEDWGVRVHEGAGKTVWARLSPERLACLPAGRKERPC
jgi:anti-sigma regulatory factor (Ser/Thr protein kinase)